MNFSRLRLGIVLALVLATASVTAGLAQTTGAPPTPAPGAVTATPAGASIPATGTGTAPASAPTVAPAPSPLGTASAGPRRGRRAASSPNPNASPSPESSDTPEPPQFSTLDGIWEVEMQPMGKRLAVYSHLNILTTGATISGYWEHAPGRTRSQMKGTFDGRLVSMDVTMPDGTTQSFSGYVENFADMVGLFRAKDSDAGTAFTAQHRKKLKV